jgi:hypothetical protein
MVITIVALVLINFIGTLQSWYFLHNYIEPLPEHADIIPSMLLRLEVPGVMQDVDVLDLPKKHMGRPFCQRTPCPQQGDTLLHLSQCQPPKVPHRAVTNRGGAAEEAEDQATTNEGDRCFVRAPCANVVKQRQIFLLQWVEGLRKEDQDGRM